MPVLEGEADEKKDYLGNVGSEQMEEKLKRCVSLEKKPSRSGFFLPSGCCRIGVALL